MTVDLPTGWAKPLLSEIAQINPLLDRCIIDNDLPVSFVPMRAVEPEGRGLLRPEVRSYSEVKKGYTPFLSGDVIMAKITPCMENGKTTVVPSFDGDVCFGSTEFHVVRPEKGVSAKWIANLLLRHDVRRAAQRQMSGGVGQMRVPSAFLETIRIPLPPASELQLISEALDELFSDLDAAVEGLERARKKLVLYRASILKEAVEGTLTADWRTQHPNTEPASELRSRILEDRRKRWEEKQQREFEEQGKEPPKDWRSKYKEPAAPSIRNQLPTGWCWVTIDQVTSGDRSCAYGVLQPGPDVDGGTPLIRVGDINLGRVNQTTLKRISPTIADNYRRTRIEGGELLITLVGTIGRTAIAPQSLKGANTARAVGVIPLAGLLKPSWVELWFRNVEKQNEMTLKAHEVARKTLNLEDVRPATVALPTLAEQEAIVEIVEDQFSVIEHLDFEIDAKLRCAEGLRHLILYHAFEGKLVPQNPTCEPASELLKRIDAERNERARIAAADKQSTNKTKRSRRRGPRAVAVTVPTNEG